MDQALGQSRQSAVPIRYISSICRIWPVRLLDSVTDHEQQ
jgi:hypothetical protein